VVRPGRRARRAELPRSRPHRPGCAFTHATRYVPTRRALTATPTGQTSSAGVNAPQLGAAPSVGSVERTLPSAPIDTDDRPKSAPDDAQDIGLASRAVAQEWTQGEEDRAAGVVARALRSHRSAFLEACLDGDGETSGLRRCGVGPPSLIVCSSRRYQLRVRALPRFTCCGRLSRPHCQERHLLHV
jgi:hypothetical protein